jgi:large subunit ribosomal protein L21
VEKMEVPVGERVELGRVLAVQGDEGLQVGRPYLRGARVIARVVEQGRGRKIRVFKMKRRKGYRKTIGHRQWYTALAIEEIQL